MPDVPDLPALGDLLRHLHRTSGQLRAIAEHLRQLAEELDNLIDQHLPPVGQPPSAPPNP